MQHPVPVNLVVEDDLAEAVARKLLQHFATKFVAGSVFPGHGYGNIKKRLPGFNNAAKSMPYFVLVDSDAHCPPALIQAWLPSSAHPNLVFRIAVTEIESWLLADRSGIASLFGISKKLVPQNTDQIADPKKCLIDLARRSRRRRLHEAIVPNFGSTARIGPDYNGQLSSFVADKWQIDEAVMHSASLCRCLRALDDFQPVWPPDHGQNV